MNEVSHIHHQEQHKTIAVQFSALRHPATSQFRKQELTRLAVTALLDHLYCCHGLSVKPTGKSVEDLQTIHQQEHASQK